MTGKLPSIKRPHLTFPILPEKEEKENQFHATFFSCTCAHFGKSFADPRIILRKAVKRGGEKGDLDTDPNSGS